MLVGISTTTIMAMVKVPSRKKQAEDNEPKVDTRPDDETLDTWPTKAEVAQSLGKSPQTVNRMRIRGDLRAYMHNGVWRHNPDDISDLTGATEEIDAAALLAVATGLIEQAQEHTEKMVTLTAVTMQKSFELQTLLSEENARCRKRIGDLEDKNADMTDSWAAAQLEQIANERITMQEDRAQRRKDQAVQFAMQQLPKAFELYIQSKSATGVLRDTMASIDDETFAMLCQSEILKPDVVEKLKAFRATMTPIPSTQKEQNHATPQA